MLSQLKVTWLIYNVSIQYEGSVLLTVKSDELSMNFFYPLASLGLTQIIKQKFELFMPQ
ncbi:MAG: hypothetical protein HC930_04775 [Hydrococcus sp. SU_1_0]|nr:hypothetical protein [Hydrococcus sp. SU_1_0]